MRSFISPINFESKYMKAKIKTRPSFWARENKYKCNSRGKASGSEKTLSNSSYPTSSWMKSRRKSRQIPTPTKPNAKGPGKLITVSHSDSHIPIPTKPIPQLSWRALHIPWNGGAHSRCYLVFPGFDEQMHDLTWTGQRLIHCTFSETETMYSYTATVQEGYKAI